MAEESPRCSVVTQERHGQNDMWQSYVCSVLHPCPFFENIPGVRKYCWKKGNMGKICNPFIHPATALYGLYHCRWTFSHKLLKFIVLHRNCTLRCLKMHWNVKCFPCSPVKFTPKKPWHSAEIRGGVNLKLLSLLEEALRRWIFAQFQLYDI